MQTTRKSSEARSGAIGLPPTEEWVLSEAAAILVSSQDRLRSIEGKGPALTAVCAIVAAAVGAAISLTWSGSTAFAKVLLVAAAGHCVASLKAPLVFAGPLSHATVAPASLRDAASAPDSVAHLVRCKLRAARTNDLIAKRLAALQAASRNALLRAILLFVLWSSLALSGVATNCGNREPAPTSNGAATPISWRRSDTSRSCRDWTRSEDARHRGGCRPLRNPEDIANQLAPSRDRSSSDRSGRL
jgi:hypothetical protein